MTRAQGSCSRHGVIGDRAVQWDHTVQPHSAFLNSFKATSVTSMAKRSLLRFRCSVHLLRNALHLVCSVGCELGLTRTHTYTVLAGDADTHMLRAGDVGERPHAK